MIPFRTQIKFFLKNPEGVDVAAFMGVFQRWIQQNALEGLLIDVADYRHVFEGPAIILIGHESDYAIESRNGQIGLLYTRKHQLEPDLQLQLRTSFRVALTACELLEKDTTFEPRLKFRTNEIEIRFADRLQLPNRPESFDLVKNDLETVLAEVYGNNTVHFAPVQQDARHIFTIKVQGEGAVGISDLFHQTSAER
jgi:hypothetical protein